MTSFQGAPPPLDPASPLLESDPIERSRTIPARRCTDPAFDVLDRDAVSARPWQAVGYAAQVAEPGHRYRHHLGGPA